MKYTVLLEIDVDVECHDPELPLDMTKQIVKAALQKLLNAYPGRDVRASVQRAKS